MAAFNIVLWDFTHVDLLDLCEKIYREFHLQKGMTHIVLDLENA